MKNLQLKSLLFLLSVCLNSFAQDGKFSFTISSPVNTSAGVFFDDSILVRTLWNNVPYTAGTYTKEWDGKDDEGDVLSSPASNYKIKILTNNVKYTWQGTVGNTSDSMTGASKHRGYYHCMRGLAFGATYGYFCTGFSEGSPSIGKFLISKPQQKLNPYYLLSSSTAYFDYVATDGTKVYWGGFDHLDKSKSFVTANNVNNDAPVSFAKGLSYTPKYRDPINVISYVQKSKSTITGLAVQKTGDYLFVARAGTDQLQVLNKTTGLLVKTLAYNNPKGLSIDENDDLWMITGSNRVAKYLVNADGTLSYSGISLPGLVEPQATQVSTDGTLVAVADDGRSQQVKFFNSSTGVLTKTLGAAGGYLNDATVNNNKFYWSDLNGSGSYQFDKSPFIAYQPDGTFWVNDGGNFRVQHYSAGGSFINRIMSLGSTYAVYVDKNNIKRVYSGFLEFEIDYSVQKLTGSTGWVLVKNWGANVSNVIYNSLQYTPSFTTTLSNGRTYGFLKRGVNYEVVELASSNQMRFTGIILNSSVVLCGDGSLQDYNLLGSNATIKRYRLIGFTNSGNPVWSIFAEILCKAKTDKVNGNPIVQPRSQVFSSTGKVVLFNYKTYANNTGPVYSKGYHLGLMQKGANNQYLFQTEKSTHKNYQGDYPEPGWFEEGNGVNDFSGGNVNIVDKNIFTSYHGEGWKNTQTNKYNHYYDNGLAIGQFGTTRPDAGARPAAMMCGNVLSATFVKDGKGDLYLWHGDESDHSGLHRWKITGLSSIAEQVITIPFPSAYAVPTPNYVDLMAGLAYDVTLQNNTAGWTRNPVANILTDPYNSFFKVVTTGQQYDKSLPNDILINYIQPFANTASVSRDLGVNNVKTNWKVSGFLAYPRNMPNGSSISQFFEILDKNDKVLTTFYPAVDRSVLPFVFSIRGNGKAIATARDSLMTDSMKSLTPFTISVVKGAVTFEYGNYAPVTTAISDRSGSWDKPKTLRARFVNNGNRLEIYGANIDLCGLKFYTDYAASNAVNQAPVSDAGTDLIITSPTNTVNLTGAGTDADGSVVSYEWALLSGNSAAMIVSSHAANTAVSGLVPGRYEFELTVMDNDGATAKDTVQLLVNIAPVVSAGANLLVTLPDNSVDLSGSATDADGIISSFLWEKISGPASGTILTPNGKATTIDNLAAGIYQFKLTITDNSGAIVKDTIQVTVNIAPDAKAGNDIVITTPKNSVTLAGGGTDADGTIKSYFWNQLSGPVASLLATPDVFTTQVSGLLPGLYQYVLTVTDNRGATGTDTIEVKVNVPPVASAGTGLLITLPTNVVTLTGSGTDSDGIVSSYYWTKVSGPAFYGVVSSPGAPTTTVTSLIAGIYQYVLTVKDENGAVGKDTVQVIVNIAPQANAGSSILITSPLNYVTLKGTGSDNDGTITDYTWIKISGPSSGTIVSDDAATTLVNNLVPGVYQFQLAVTDNRGAVARDIVQVEVNMTPVADAGNDIILTLPRNYTTLNGSGTDADGAVKSYSWIKKSGPFAGWIFAPNSPSPQLANLSAGVYEYELTVTDNDGAIGKDTIRLTVNISPVVNAGADKLITLPVNDITLTGVGTDVDGTIDSYAWAKISGPSAGTIANYNAATTVVNNLVAGIYQFELTVTDDNGMVVKDIVQVTVNIPPVANAGAGIIITAPKNTVILNGNGSDADGSVQSFLWKKISGPAAGLVYAPTYKSTIVTGLLPGVYRYQLAVTDNRGAVITDTVQVIVNIPPVVNAGADMVILFPQNSVTLTGSAQDADGTIDSYAWAKISGPPSWRIITDDAASTDVNNLVAGVYEFELTVTDNYGAAVKSTVEVTVNLAPTADAGKDISVPYPANIITLKGKGKDQDGYVKSYSWSQISGSRIGVMYAPNSAQPQVAGLIPGVYEYELTVTDNLGAIGTDQVEVTVNAPASRGAASSPAPNKIPSANAGADKVLTSYTDTLSLTGSGTDTDGFIKNYLWTKLSGPTGNLIHTPGSPVTHLSGLVVGTYQYLLTVTDNAGAKNTDSVTVTIKSPSANTVKVYPNPVTDFANLSLITNSINKKVAISLYNSAGMLLNFKQVLTPQTKTSYKLDMFGISSGVYFIELRFDDGQKISYRIMKN